MKIKALSLYYYPDQLLSDIWVNWSENVLNKKHDDVFSSPRGFQDVLGSDTSSHRTRAGELYTVGLLRGPLVNPRQASKNSIPSGWKLNQSNQNVHTRLGYCAYALGKAIRNREKSVSVDQAFSALCTIFLLQIGFKYKNHYILTSSLFNYILNKFKPSSRTMNEDLKWQRYVATAMFSTLQEETVQSNLLDSYLKGATINGLYLIEENSRQVVTPDTLAQMMDDDESILNILPKKPSLFWIGDQTKTHPRGLYPQGSIEGKQLLSTIAEIEWNCIANGLNNPFRVLIEKPTESEPPCVLQELSNILTSYDVTKQEWERLMDTLYKGVIDSLRFIGGGDVSQDQYTFYVHDPEATTVEDNVLILEVKKQQCSALPKINDLVILNKRTFVVKDIKQAGEYLRIQIERPTVRR